MTNSIIHKSIERWQEMVETRDMNILNELLSEDVVFRSPVVYKSYAGREIVSFILSNVIQILENFTYHREFMSDDGLNIVFEFSAKIGDKDLKGIDMIQFNHKGEIVDFEVMIRPRNGLDALAILMVQRMENSI